MGSSQGGTGQVGQMELPVSLVLLLLAVTWVVEATVSSCLYCNSDPNQLFYDHDCEEGSHHITRMHCTPPYTAGCVVFTLTGTEGPHTYRDCCHQGTGDRTSCSGLPESYEKKTLTLKQSCSFDDCNMFSTSTAVTTKLRQKAQHTDNTAAASGMARVHSWTVTGAMLVWKRVMEMY